MSTNVSGYIPNNYVAAVNAIEQHEWVGRAAVLSRRTLVYVWNFFSAAKIVGFIRTVPISAFWQKLCICIVDDKLDVEAVRYK